MSWFNIFRKNKGIKPLHTKRMPLRERIKQSGQSHYVAEMAVLYEGKPLRSFTSNVKAHSREHAASKVQEGLSLKLLSIRKAKRNERN